MKQLTETRYGKRAVIGTISILILVLSTNGAFESAFNKIGMRTVEKQNTQFLESSMKMATGYFAGLGVIKGTIAVLSEVEVSTIVITTKAGKVLSAIQETIDTLWEFFGYSMASILAQVTLLKFFKFFSMNILVPLGALMVGLSAFNLKLFRKFGIMMLLAGFILYVAMPLTIFTSRMIMNNIAMEETISLNEKIAVLDLKTNDIKQSDDKSLIERHFKSLETAMGGSLDIMTNAAAKQIAILFVVFLLTPFLFYGLLYSSFKGFQFYLTNNANAPDRFEDFLTHQTSRGLTKITDTMQNAVTKMKKGAKP